MFIYHHIKIHKHMKQYDLKVAQGWNVREEVDIQLELPDDMFFWVDKGYIGSGKWEGTEHYTTIFQKDNYKELQEQLEKRPIFSVRTNLFGEYIILQVLNLCNETPLPVKDRLDIFKENNVSFDNMVVYHTNKYGELLNAMHIVEFKNIDRITCNIVTFRSLFGDEMYSISTSVFNNRQIYNEYDRYTNDYILYDEEALILWNSMVKVVTDMVLYDPSLADLDYNFEKHEKEYKKDLQEFCGDFNKSSKSCSELIDSLSKLI